MMNYDDILSDKVKTIKPSGIRKYFDIAAEYDDVLSLSIGEPDFPTPWHIREAGIESLEHGRTKYTANAGMRELRIEIGRYMQRRFNLDYDENEILVTVGGSEAIDLAIRSLINPGDEVLVPEPSFVCYSPITTLAGGVPVPIVTKKEDDFKLTAAALKKAITPKTKLLVLPFPNNPTGAVMTRRDLSAIARVLKDTDIMVLSDEIYAELTYGSRHVSIANLDGMRERTVIINGFSKAYSMTGWRLGFAAGPRPVIEKMKLVHQYGIMSAPTTSQYAAVDALKNGDHDIDEMRAEYDRRRQFILAGLRDMGLSCFEPFGAFYIFPDISGFGMTSDEFCQRLLKEQRLAVVPGSAFGDSGDGFLRISYAYSVDSIRLALERLEKFIKRL